MSATTWAPSVAEGFASGEEEPGIRVRGDGMSLSSFWRVSSVAMLLHGLRDGVPLAAAESGFRAVLEKERGLGWTIARVPLDPPQARPKMIRFRVRGELLVPRFGRRCSPMATAIFFGGSRDAERARAACGDSVEIALEPDMSRGPWSFRDAPEALLEDEAGLEGVAGGCPRSRCGARLVSGCWG